MDELKRCSGYKGHWVCADEYPDHMVPISRFTRESKPQKSTARRQQKICKACRSYLDVIFFAMRPRHPVTGEAKMNWKYRVAKSLGGTSGTLEWESYLKRAEAVWGLEVGNHIISVEPNAIPKFKSKKPKFNQGQYKSSPNTPRDRTNKVVPKEGPGDVYIFEDIMKMPGLKKIGTTTDVGKRLQSGDTWGAFTCLYTKEFKRRFEAEAKVHELLDDYRVYRNKEWFKVNTDLAIKTIEGMYELP